MCGRAYETYTEEELLLRYLGEKRKRNPLGDFKPNFNMCPSQLSPVVLVRDGVTTIERMRWGLVPFWAKDVKSAAKYSLINARSEEIMEKRSYKQAFEKRRCIVPLSGFFEWKRSEEGPKVPFAIRFKDQSILSVAGVWEHCEDKKEGTELNSFSILTTGPNALMKRIHNRMPVILNQKDEAKWLDPDNHNTAALQKLLKPCEAKLLEAYEVSAAVNSPKNNRPEVLKPIS